jgi:hypothetical protein
MCKMIKLIICVLVVIMGYSYAHGAGAEAGNAFPFKSAEILKSYVDSKSSSGCAILTNGRMLYYKRWLTEDSSALEATLVDTNEVPDTQKDWFSDDYISGRILWLSKLVLNETDNRIVMTVFKEKKYKKEIQKDGVIVFHIPGTNYSEFYFAVRQPGGYIDDASVKVRYVLTL